MENVWIVGISCSLIASLVVIGTSYVMKNLIVPKMRGILLKVPDISGMWEGCDNYELKDCPIRRLSIKQIGTRVSAKLRREHDANIRIFHYEGIFQSGQLVLSFEEKGGEGYILGTIILYLSSNLNQLKGKATYYHHNKGEVVCSDRLYKRIPS
jgi:hypothetical protein